MAKMPSIPLDATGAISALTEIVERREGIRRGSDAEKFVTLADLQSEQWQAPKLLNGWVNYDATFNPAGFYKDKFGIVHLRGMIKSGTINTTAFVLPIGYRPQYQFLLTSISNNLIARLDVKASGEVIPVMGDTAWFSLDTVSFRIA